MINQHKNLHILIAFHKRGGNLVFKAIYSYNFQSQENIKIFGDGPNSFTTIIGFYKYDSAAKQFTSLPLTSLSPTVDGIILKNIKKSSSIKTLMTNSNSTYQLISKNNRKLLINAINHVLLAGEVNSSLRTQVVNELKQAPGEHFLLYVNKHGGGVKLKAIYIWDIIEQIALLLYGDGPAEIKKDQFKLLYKYNTSKKQFDLLIAQKFSRNVDAFTLQNF